MLNSIAQHPLSGHTSNQLKCTCIWKLGVTHHDMLLCHYIKLDSQTFQGLQYKSVESIEAKFGDVAWQPLARSTRGISQPSSTCSNQPHLLHISSCELYKSAWKWSLTEAAIQSVSQPTLIVTLGNTEQCCAEGWDQSDVLMIRGGAMALAGHNTEPSWHTHTTSKISITSIPWPGSVLMSCSKLWTDCWTQRDTLRRHEGNC